MRYFINIFVNLWRLGQGMWVTMLNFVRPKVTEQYPENRGEKVWFERFRAQLTMPHDGQNHHRCTACGLCAAVCPNKTITVEVRQDDGKRVLDRHLYDLGSCTFCALCVAACPFGAIEFTNCFEHAVFTREKLLEQLNRPGSSLAPKPAAGESTEHESLF